MFRKEEVSVVPKLTNFLRSSCSVHFLFQFKLPFFASIFLVLPYLNSHLEISPQCEVLRKVFCWWFPCVDRSQYHPIIQSFFCSFYLIGAHTCTYFFLWVSYPAIWIFCLAIGMFSNSQDFQKFLYFFSASPLFTTLQVFWVFSSFSLRDSNGNLNASVCFTYILRFLALYYSCFVEVFGT